MKDFASAWEALSSEEDPDPKVQKQRELDRLHMLSTAAATQALWNMAKKRILFVALGVIFLPPIAFNLTMNALPGGAEDSSNGVVALAAWALTAIAIFFISKRIVDSDPATELEKTSQALIIADDAFRKKWGEPKRPDRHKS